MFIAKLRQTPAQAGLKLASLPLDPPTHPAWFRSNINKNTHGQFLVPSSLETVLRKTLCLTKTSVGQFFPSVKILGVNRMEAKIVGKKIGASVFA